MKSFMKLRFKFFHIAVAVLACIVLILCLAMFWVNYLFEPPKTLVNGQAVIDVPNQANADTIAKILYEKDLIKSRRVFSFYVRYTGADSKLKAGEYRLDSGQTLPQIVDKMIKGSSMGYNVTIPEGFNLKQITDLLVSKKLVDRENFYKGIQEGDFDYSFLKGVKTGDNRLEGYLFPDTYFFDKNRDGKEIINIMLSRFNEVMGQLQYEQKARQLGLTLNQAVTIASLIEREAKYDKERTVIAGVIFNRLRMGMPLQIDATVQYALGTNRIKLYNKDLEINSPYNTYRINGLPPGPIASPGKASLLAVVNPDKSNYLYYLAKPDGTHVFAVSLEEHNKNKAIYIK
ncbi:aminodeoxychorismate lyase [Desulfofarcimen acetoxidans DSM 771]|uniref:Endolytic murein transglycosylase n=1 Tax=Desulfofarcimen acetoxidans (strain ATCC 49208 / DSM 771 / KCTC 5769 / VKM B-1644 / 5575) TaxID=485916 RepID=C8VZU8_DESAS|nr:endolytic transglycosylase MltG [Desulfofarcimen acetoxidans]ACV63076.1 aminodeoxychorismate lyase [Desulfofarcimen acetoxidans DSM 771]